MNSLAQQITINLLPYVTSAFKEHSLTATTNIFSQLIAGILKLPVAKLMDVWGRPQGFVLVLICTVFGKDALLPCNPIEVIETKSDVPS